MTDEYSQPLSEGEMTWTIDWAYPAFHFVMKDPRKKPPVNTPFVTDWPKHVMRPRLNSFIMGADNKVSFNLYKLTVRSRISHDRVMPVWVYAPNKELALRYAKLELNIKLNRA